MRRSVWYKVNALSLNKLLCCYTVIVSIAMVDQDKSYSNSEFKKSNLVNLGSFLILFNLRIFYQVPKTL